MKSTETKQLIKDSLVRLLNQRPLDKITVKDVVEECGINRNTFYYHYQDLFEVVEEVLVPEKPSGKLPDSWQDSVLYAARFALENKKAVYHLYNSARRSRMEDYFFEAIEPVIAEYIRRQSEGLKVSEEDMDYLCVFYKSAVVGIFRQWMQDGMKKDPAEGIKRLGELIDGNLRRSLERAAGGQ